MHHRGGIVNPLMPNRHSHPYELDESISNYRVTFFILNRDFNRIVCKQTV